MILNGGLCLILFRIVFGASKLLYFFPIIGFLHVDFRTFQWLNGFYANFVRLSNEAVMEVVVDLAAAGGSC